MFLRRHQCPSRLVTLFLGTLWGSIKQIKAPYMFDLEHGIALNTMQGSWGSSHEEGEVSWFFSSCGGNLGYILELWWGCSFKAHIFSATSRHLSSYEGQLRNLLKSWQGNTDASRVEAGDPGSLSSCHSDTGIPINFQQDSGIVPF